MKKDRKTVRGADIKKAHSVKKTGMRFQNLYQQIIAAETTFSTVKPNSLNS